MLYESLKLVHVLAVIAWFGGSLMLAAIAGRAARVDGTALAGVARLGSDLGSYFGAAAGIALLAGIGMMFTSAGPGWDEAWIAVGFVAWAIAAVAGARFISPGWAKVAEAADGGDAAAAQAARRSLLPVTMVELTLLLIAVAAMVYKWGA